MSYRNTSVHERIGLNLISPSHWSVLWIKYIWRVRVTPRLMFHLHEFPFKRAPELTTGITAATRAASVQTTKPATRGLVFVTMDVSPATWHPTAVKVRTWWKLSFYSKFHPTVILSAKYYVWWQTNTRLLKLLWLTHPNLHRKRLLCFVCLTLFL